MLESSSRPRLPGVSATSRRRLEEERVTASRASTLGSFGDLLDLCLRILKTELASALRIQPLATNTWDGVAPEAHQILIRALRTSHSASTQSANFYHSHLSFAVRVADSVSTR